MLTIDNAALRLSLIAWIHRIASAFLISYFWLRGVCLWLFGSLWGVLVRSTLAYRYARLRDSKPFTSTQLLSWYSEQRSEVQLGILGAALTIVGFAVAFGSPRHGGARRNSNFVLMQARRSTSATSACFAP